MPLPDASRVQQLSLSILLGPVLADVHGASVLLVTDTVGSTDDSSKALTRTICIDSELTGPLRS